MGLEPVPIDCDSKYLISFEGCKKYIDENGINDICGILVVHLFGLSVETKNFKKLKIPIIEDFCHIFFDKVRLVGDFGFFSFDSSKLIAGGEGGALIYKKRIYNNVIYDEILLNRKIEKTIFAISDITAALIMNQIKKRQKFYNQRKIIAFKYFNFFKNENIKLNVLKSDFINYFRLPIYLEDFSYNKIELLIKEFYKKGIVVRRPVDLLISNYLRLKKRRRFQKF